VALHALKIAIDGDIPEVKSALDSLGWDSEELDAMTERQLRQVAAKRQPASTDKWLEKQQGQLTLYHGTTSAALEDIEKNGLRAQSSTFRDVGQEAGVFVVNAHSKRWAEYWANKAAESQGGDPIVLLVTIPRPSVQSDPINRRSFMYTPSDVPVSSVRKVIKLAPQSTQDFQFHVTVDDPRGGTNNIYVYDIFSGVAEQVDFGGKSLKVVEGADDPHETEKARIERKIQRAMLAYWQGLAQRVLTQVRKQGKTLKYDPAQPRDESGRWTSTGAGGKKPTVEGAKNRDLVEEMLNEGLAYSWRNSSSAERAAAKMKICQELAERTGMPEQEVSYTLRQWARTSNDEEMASLSLQADTAKEFALPVSEFTQGKIRSQKIAIQKESNRLQGLGLEPDEIQDALQGTEFAPLADSSTQRTLLRAMYQNTQQQLHKQGLSGDDTVTLYRGVKLPDLVAKNWQAGDIVSIDGNPLESWSVSVTAASDFAMNPRSGQTGVTLIMDIPIKMIIGSATTGFGCLAEGEVVVLGSLGGVAEVMGTN